MTWFAIEVQREDPKTPFTEDLIIGRIRFNEDGTMTWVLDANPPRNATVILHPLEPAPEIATPEIAVPDLDVMRPLTAREQRLVRQMRGRGSAGGPR